MDTVIFVLICFREYALAKHCINEKVMANCEICSSLVRDHYNPFCANKSDPLMVTNGTDFFFLIMSSVCLSFYPSVWLSVCLSACHSLSVCLTFCRSLVDFFSVCLSFIICLFGCLLVSVCFFVCLPVIVYLSVWLSVGFCLSISLFVSHCLSVSVNCLSVVRSGGR